MKPMRFGNPICNRCQQVHPMSFDCEAAARANAARLAAPLLPPPKREKFLYIGAPACFALEQAMQHVNAAFDDLREGRFTGAYVVGSVLERPDWRDVDVRFIMDDRTFAETFPDAEQHWEFDPKWLLLTVAISKWLSDQTGLPIDFQFQSMTHANEKHKKRRNAVGLKFAKRQPNGDDP